MERRTRHVLMIMILAAALTGLGSLTLFGLYRSGGRVGLRAAAVGLLIVSYHLGMRLLVGETVTALFRDRSFPQDRLGFRLRPYESGLYRKLKVKRWKLRMLTAKPEQFDLSRVSPGELLHNVMQAELVHRVSMALSFAPLLLIFPFGTPWAFLLTSAAACLPDGVCVMIQRYNRPRVLRLVTRAEKSGRAAGAKENRPR